jgi:outer membrane protein assembly factor BamB
MAYIIARHTALALLLTWSAGATEDWPMFRGPNASGVSETAKPPQDFGPGNNVAWKVEVPWSPGSLCVVRGRIFLNSFSNGTLETRAYAASGGERLWTGTVTPKEIEEFHSTDGSPAAGTPASDGQRVVSYFGSCGVVTYDFEGKELWRYAMPTAKTTGGYGSGTSPLLAGDSVVVCRDVANNSSLYCLDLKTGKLKWETPRPEAITSYGTPILWRNNGVDEIVTPGTLLLKGYDLQSGQHHWLLSGVTHIACTTPVAGDGMLYFAGWGPGKADQPWPNWEGFLASNDKNKDGIIDEQDVGPAMWSYMKGLDMDFDGRLTKADFDRLQSLTAKGQNVLVALKPGCKGDVSDSHIAWKATKGLPYVPSPLYYQGRIYLVKDGGILSCYDAKTGDAIWQQERLPSAGSYYASPVAADSRIFLASLDGKLTVLKAGTEKPEVLRTIDFGERIGATPALAGDRIFVRTASKLYAFGSTGLARASH